MTDSTPKPFVLAFAQTRRASVTKRSWVPLLDEFHPVMRLEYQAPALHFDEQPPDGLDLGYDEPQLVRDALPPDFDPVSFETGFELGLPDRRICQ